MIFYNSKTLDALIAKVNRDEVYRGQDMTSDKCNSDCVYISYCHESSNDTVINDKDDLAYIIEQITDCIYGHDTAGFFKLNSIYSHAFRLKNKNRSIIF